MSAFESMMSVLINTAALTARTRRRQAAWRLSRERWCLCTDVDGMFCDGGGLPRGAAGKYSCWCHASTTQASSAG